jgi:putative exosortase-associated protein (TIGR04073 family)
MLRKFGRGIANITTSAFEIPKSIQESLYDDGPVAAATYGLFDGIFKFVVRTVVGVFEVVTFPIPIPADYAPIVEPEFLFSPDEPYSF